MALDTSADDLRDRFREYTGYYTKWDTEMTDAKSAYDGSFKIVKPPLTDKYIPPTGRSRTDLAVGQIITDSPKVQRHREQHDERGKAYDDKIELALQGFLLEAEEYLQTPPLHEAGQFQMQRGAAVFGGPLWDAREERVWFEVYDPRTIKLEPGAEPREGFLHVQLTVAAMEKLARQHRRFAPFKRESRLSTERITLVQWWSWDPDVHLTDKGIRQSGQYAAWIEEQTDLLQTPEPSGYPYLPLDIVASGWGTRALGALPEEIYVPLLHQGVRDMLRAEAEMFTMLHSYAQQVVWARYKAKPGTTVPRDFTINPLPNSITFDWPDDLEPFEIPPMPREVAEELGRIMGYLDNAFQFSTILGGQRQPGVPTASGIAQMAAGSRKRFHSPVRLLQGGTARLLLRLGWLVDYLTVAEKIAPTFKWRGVTLENKMYGGDYTVEVDLRAKDDEERRLMIAEGQSLKDILSEREIYEDYVGRENYTESRRERMLDRVLASEGMVEMVAQVAQLALQSKLAERQRQDTDNQTPNDERDIVERFAQMYRAARTGNAPAEPGTVEGAAQQAGQERRIAVPPVGRGF